jgi:ubiquinone/menaquinone biosynthesis C-methylase UbiE
VPIGAARGLIRPAVPAALLWVAARRRTGGAARSGAVALLLAVWTAVYVRYRRAGRFQTAHEYELARTATLEAYHRHYNERVPTIEEEFDVWGEYHQHRHEMRYDLVADHVRRHARDGSAILDIGCGSALVADRIIDLDVRYIGLDYPSHHVAYVRKRFEATRGRLAPSFVQGDGGRLPLRDASIDVVVLSEVIEHLMRPELAVWEIARVLRPGGVLVMTTNNASEVPLRSPLSHLFAWVEKAVGATRPRAISLRPWVWPHPIDPDLLPPGSPPVYLPHTHHIQGETRQLFRAAGLETTEWSTFEFPPPQSQTAQWLDARGEPGRRAVDVIEAIATRLPVVRRLGCHLLMVATKVGAPCAPTPPPGIWPGPFSS